MNRNAVLCGVFVSLTLLTWLGSVQMPRAFVSQEQCQAPEGTLEATPGLIEFGALPENSTPSFIVTLVNRSLSPLTIDRIATTCGCTEAALSASKLAPKESATLVVTVRPSPSEPAIEGRVRVAYSTASPGGADELVIPVRGSVQAEYEVSPKALAFVSGQSPVQYVDISPLRDRNLTVVSAIADNDAFQISVFPRRISVRYDATKSKGARSRSGHIIVKTTNALHPTEVVRVGVVAPALSTPSQHSAATVRLPHEG